MAEYTTSHLVELYYLLGHPKLIESRLPLLMTSILHHVRARLVLLLLGVLVAIATLLLYQFFKVLLQMV